MIASVKPYKVSVFGVSDIGLVRENNEDVWAKIPGKNIFILADGMGGHRAGEVAASEAVRSFIQQMTKVMDDKEYEMSLNQMRSQVEYAIQLINAHVYEMGCRDRELRGMGTTFCSLHFHQNGVVYAHVGDSRIYRLRGHHLMQLTRDHSLLRELVDLGQISEDEAKEFLYKNIITKAIGTEPFVEPSVHVADLNAGDLFLMCSDGLSDLLDEEEIQKILTDELSLKDKAQIFIETAKEKGGQDNITVVLLEVEEIDHGGKNLS